MNNLKRVLSLGLAGTMLSGLMVTGAGALDVKDFTDSDDIQHQEAVATMAALNVINGKDDGKFDPSATITRAEMVKMIAVMLNGGKEPVLSTTSQPHYSDIENHWAKNYIEYAHNQGIIAGRGDGTFDPDGTVTGSQVAKMALVALGYDPEIFGFVGIDWEINTNRRANDPDAALYTDLAGVNPSEGMSRDNAAQLLYNTLFATMMRKTYDKVIDGQVSYKYELDRDVNNNYNYNFLERKFNAVKVEGIVVANEDADLEASSQKGGHLDVNRTKIEVTNYQGTSPGREKQSRFYGDVTLQASTGLEELGQKINVYVKIDTSLTKAEILGDVVLSDDNTVITDYTGDPAADIMDDLHYDPSDDIRYAANYRALSGKAPSLDLKDGKHKGREKILIDNDDDGDIEIVLINEYKFGKVTSYVESGNGSLSISPGMSVDTKDDVVGFDDVARDDYVLAQFFGGRLWVEKAEFITGELDSYKANGSGQTEKLEVDGDNYNVAWIDGYTAGENNIIAAKSYGSNELDKEATFYFGKGNYIIAVGDSKNSAGDYCLLLGVDSTNGIDERVKVALSDGSKHTYTLNTGSSGLTVRQLQECVGMVFAYNLGSNGKIKLTPIKVDSVDGDLETHVGDNGPTNGIVSKDGKVTYFAKGNSTVSIQDPNDASKTTNYYTKSSTAFFYVKGAKPHGTTVGGTDDMYDQGFSISTSDVNVYTGYNEAPKVNVNNINPVYGRVYLNAAGNRVVAVVFYGDSIEAASMDDTMYIFGRGNTNNDYTEVNAFLAGDTTRYDGDNRKKIDSGSKTLAEKVGVYNWTLNSDGYYELDPIDWYGGTSGNRINADWDNNGNRVIGSRNDWRVKDSESNSFLIRGYAGTGTGADSMSFKVTDKTLLVDDSNYLDDPIASLGQSPSVDDYIDYVVFNLDGDNPEEAVLIVVNNPKANTGSGDTDETKTDASITFDASTYTVTVRYSAGARPTPYQVQEAIRAQLGDGATVRVTNNGNSYNVTVDIGRGDVECNVDVAERATTQMGSLTLTPATTDSEGNVTEYNVPASDISNKDDVTIGANDPVVVFNSTTNMYEVAQLSSGNFKVSKELVGNGQGTLKAYKAVTANVESGSDDVSFDTGAYTDDKDQGYVIPGQSVTVKGNTGKQLVVSYTYTEPDQKARGIVNKTESLGVFGSDGKITWTVPKTATAIKFKAQDSVKATAGTVTVPTTPEGISAKITTTNGTAVSNNGELEAGKTYNVEVEIDTDKVAIKSGAEKGTLTLSTTSDFIEITKDKADVTNLNTNPTKATLSFKVNQPTDPQKAVANFTVKPENFEAKTTQAPKITLGTLTGSGDGIVSTLKITDSTGTEVTGTELTAGTNYKLVVTIDGTLAASATATLSLTTVPANATFTTVEKSSGVTAEETGTDHKAVSITALTAAAAGQTNTVTFPFTLSAPSDDVTANFTATAAGLTAKAG